MKRWYGVAAFVFGTLLPVAANAGWTLEGGIEHFSWRESSSLSVTETGPRLILGGSWLPQRESAWRFGWKGKLYAGSVDYDGAFLFSGAPARGTTQYAGAANELVVLYSPPEPRFAGTDVVGGLGLDVWQRELSARQREDYTVLFARLGLQHNAQTRKGWFGGGGIKLPLFTREDAHLQDIGFDQNPILRPGKEPSLYAEVGYRFSATWSLVGYYDSYRFSRSAVEAVTIAGAPVSVFQPESRVDTFGLRVAYGF